MVSEISTYTPSAQYETADDEMGDGGVDALAERIYSKLVEMNGPAQSPMVKQGIQLLLASGLMELYEKSKKDKEKETHEESHPAGAPIVQSPTAMYDASSPTRSISSAAAASSSSSSNYNGMTNPLRQRQQSSTSSASAHSPATTHTRSFSSSSSASSTMASPLLSSSSSLRRSSTTTTTRKKAPLKILDLSIGDNATISTLLTLMSIDGLIHPREELEITASETDPRVAERLRDKFKEWYHWRLKVFAPESIPARADTYDFVFHSLGMHWVRDEDSALHEMYRVLRPGGTVGFTSFQSIGYTSAGPEDPLSILPNSGWTSPSSIHKKLSKHGFTDIQIYEYRFTHIWEKGHMTSRQVIQFIIDHAIKKLWKDENDVELDGETKDAMREQLLSMFEKGQCTEDIIALITLARKPCERSALSYF